MALHLIEIVPGALFPEVKTLVARAHTAIHDGGSTLVESAWAATAARLYLIVDGGAGDPAVTQAALTARLGAEELPVKEIAVVRLVGKPGKGTNEVFTSELRALDGELDRVEEAIVEDLSAPAATGADREIVELRLSAARLAGAASRLECKLVGGAGYAARSATARRLRGAAFLPIQSPTEGQLLWELSRATNAP